MTKTTPQIIDRIQSQYINELPFMVYSSPGDKEVVGYLQNDAKLHRSPDLCDHSAIMVPFSPKSEICIPYAQSEKICMSFDATEQPITESVSIEETEADKKRYIELVSKALHQIDTTKTEKIVTSRTKDIALSNFDFSVLLHRLFHLYPDAFTYIWYHPETGLWCGATPEVLLITEGNSFKTMALAGTQKVALSENPVWGPKERQEQLYVTNAIAEKLQKITSVVKISKTYTHRAGTLAHLRTDIEGIVKKSKAGLKDIAMALHPTPAVCGSPTHLAKNFLSQNEKYDREFYTGFVGYIDTERDTAALYVNLRCMKIESTTATLFVGGGITSGSIPNLEWEETQNKLQTMLQVLSPML